MEKKRGGPKMLCAKSGCGEKYHTRTKVCPKCGTPNPSYVPGGKSSGGRKTKTTLDDVLAFISLHFKGDIEAAIAELNRLKKAGLTADDTKQFTRESELQAELTKLRTRKTEVLSKLEAK